VPVPARADNLPQPGARGDGASAVSVPAVWDSLVVGVIGLAGVVVGQQMSRDAAQDAQYLQIEQQRRLEVRRLLVRLLVDVRAQIEQAWVLLPMMTRFEPSDFTEFVETDTGRAMGERGRRVEEDVTALALLVPDGPVRASLARLETVAVREWSEKAVGPVTNKKPPEDGRDRIEVAFEQVRACRLALNDVQREAALYLAVPPQRPPSLRARLRDWPSRRGAVRPPSRGAAAS
jgi:hypothetical protein